MILDYTMQNSPRLSDAIRQSLGGLDAFKILKESLQESLPINKKSTAHLYEYDDKRTLAQRKKDNKEAEAILKKVKEQGYQVTEADKAALAKYSGKGGAITGADGKKGSQYEYYTPAPIAEGMWTLLKELGFNGGKVLDPSSGTGVFGATSPTNAVIDAVELNETSGMVQKLVNDNEFYSTIVSPFEKVAANNPDELYDLVITNVPFGDTTARGANFQHDPKYQKETLQGYFILRSLEKLKPRGLAAFIVPPSVVTGLDAKAVSVRQRATMMAEFIGAYRLPNEVFGTANADTMTDVIVFRKFSTDAADKVNEIKEQNPQVLMDALVQWDVFLEGKWYKENPRFVLGTFIPKNPEAHHASPEGRDRVTNDASMPELAKMLKKFPKSRINWDLLNTTETDPIIYKNGDTLVQSGQTLRFKNGQWEVLPRSEDSNFAITVMAECDTALSAFSNKVKWNDAKAVCEFMFNTSRGLEIPNWLRNTYHQLLRIDQDSHAKYWYAIIVALSMNEVLDQHLSDTGFNYLEEYPELSTAIQQIAAIAQNPPAKLSGAKETLKAVKNHYGIKTGFSAVWKGDVTTLENKAVDAENSFEGLMYKSQSAWVDLEQVKTVLGADFNPFESSDYCLSGDGKKVIKADDYYVGNLNEFLLKLDADIETAKGNDLLVNKLLRQREEALKRVDVLNPSDLNFNLFSPLVTVEEKEEFIKQFLSPNTLIKTNNRGKRYVDIDSNAKTDEERLLNRFGDYLGNGTITLANTKFDNLEKMEALRKLREMTVTANTQFEAWVKARPDIMARLNQEANDPAKLQFRPIDDESQLAIAGMNPALRLHGYQCSFVRQKARKFDGINGFDVGLGKTFTALASVQYAHNMGVKKKTCFIVPNSVLSNWKKEAARAYDSIDNCLFVGLRVDKQGREQSDSSQYAIDLTRIMENRHSKIFMSYEAFQMLRLKDDTLKGFIGYLRQNDNTFQFTSDDKANEKIENYLAKIEQAISSDKKASVPFLEDLGVDSFVFDEAHLLKNSTQAAAFKSAKYLSLAPASKRGIDAQSKCWYIRGASPLKDGVLLLTATPITNSPLEIYSMFSLSIGHEAVNNLCMGVTGADKFMETVCIKQSEDDVTIDGIERVTDVFVGLANVSILRNVIKNTATIKNATDVGDQIIVPEGEHAISDLQLDDDTIAMLQKYKGAFRFAIDSISGKKATQGDPKAFEEISEKFGLPLELVGHPFNLLKNMELLVMDKDLDERATFFTFPDDQLDKAKKAIAEFNKLNRKSIRPRKNPHTSDDAVLDTITKKDETTGDVKEWLEIHVQAGLIDDDKRIVIDTMDTLEISDFETIAENLGLDLDVTIPPKLAALIENFNREMTNPRGMIKNEAGEVVKSPIVKQIIFCDLLGFHNKVRRILAKKCGIPKSKIATVTGKTNNEADAILDVQNGFNASGADNKYQVILANEKAEVGINLQIGTQAIHHLTIGWTPDSLQQRNGRGQRQGNLTEKVNIYFYDADGTFDKQKRAMVDRKSEWIDSLMSNQSVDSIAIEGGMSREQMELLIESVGDKDAMARIQESMAAKEAESRAKNNRDKQLINLNTISKQTAWLNDNKTAENYVKSALFSLENMYNNVRKLEKAKTTAKTAANIRELKGMIDALIDKVEASCTIYRLEYNYRAVPAAYERKGKVDIKTLASNPATFAHKKTAKLKDVLNGYSDFEFEMIEGGAITSEWQQNKELAENMVTESAKNYEKQATVKNAMPSAVAKAMASGDGIFLSGHPLVKGMFCIVGANTFVVSEINLDKKTADVMAITSDFRVHQNTLNADRINQVTKFVYQGTGEYTETAKELATLEDGIGKKAVGADTKLYSDYSDEVAQYRTTKTLVKITNSIGDYTLPPPYFPIPITPSMGLNTPLGKRIMDEQKAVIKAFEKPYDTATYDYIIVEKGTQISEAKNRGDGLRFNRICGALAIYAKAHGLTISKADFEFMGEKLSGWSGADDVLKVYAAENNLSEKLANDLASIENLAQIEDEARAFMDKELGFMDEDLRKLLLSGNAFHAMRKNEKIFEKFFDSKQAEFIKALTLVFNEDAEMVFKNIKSEMISSGSDFYKKQRIEKILMGNNALEEKIFNLLGVDL